MQGLNKGKHAIRAILFDFDGTLARLNIDFPLMRRSVLELIGAFGVPRDGLADLYVLEMIEAGGRRIAEIRPETLADFRKEAYGCIESIEMEAARRGGLLEGIRPMFGALRRNLIRTGVVSRNSGAAIAEIFPDIHDHCNAVIPRELTSHVKPHPEHLLTALRALQVRPEASAMVGDHPMDIVAGREVGLMTIGVLTGSSGPEAMREASPDIILNRAPDIVGLL
ncbi:MAG: HAD hydrolase-like protein [Deltaproteobacteria bacterium]|nr:HAD hydrolase-like protein [Deltaproteobacteria bacterium]